MLRKPTAALLAVALFPAVLIAQEHLEVDLGDLGPGAHSFPRKLAESYSVLIRNRVVDGPFGYRLQVTIRNRPIASFTWPGGGTDVGQLAASEECKPVVSAHETVKAAPTEAAVKVAVVRAREIERDPEYEDCKNELRGLRAIIESTLSVHPIGQIRNNQDVVVQITRTGETDGESRSWTVTFEGRDPGRWLTTYGFSFVTDVFTEDRAYSTRPAEDEGRFLIREVESNTRMAFVPSVMLSWIPAQSDEIQFVFSGGLGFDLTDPVVMLSPIGINYNQNLTLHLGLAAAKVSRLTSQYDVGQEVGENLTEEQLRTRDYRINPFVSLSFNFTTNPFGAGTPQEESSEGDSASGE